MMRIDTWAAVCAAGAIAGLIISAPSAMADPDAPATPAPPPPATADGMPHLSSPDNLPPGTTDTPPGPGQGHSLSYLRELWQALQNQDIDRKDAAILLLTQRPMDPNAAAPGLAPGPQQAPGQQPGPPAPQLPN